MRCWNEAMGMDANFARGIHIRQEHKVEVGMVIVFFVRWRSLKPHRWHCWHSWGLRRMCQKHWVPSTTTNIALALYCFVLRIWIDCITCTVCMVATAGLIIPFLVLELSLWPELMKISLHWAAVERTQYVLKRSEHAQIGPYCRMLHQHMLSHNGRISSITAPTHIWVYRLRHTPLSRIILPCIWVVSNINSTAPQSKHTIRRSI